MKSGLPDKKPLIFSLILPLFVSNKCAIFTHQEAIGLKIWIFFNFA
jgi:hypothetical protein